MNQIAWQELRRRGLTAPQLLSALGIWHVPVDVERMAKSMGIQVVRTEEESDYEGCLYSNETEAIIKVNPKSGRQRQRFTIAHEIGHLMLHPLGLSFREVDFQGGAKEREANRYAADILMPFSALYILESKGLTLEQLAALFDVSVPAMRVRLETTLLRQYIKR